jgi:hypothetical protein
VCYKREFRKEPAVFKENVDGLERAQEFWDLLSWKTKMSYL